MKIKREDVILQESQKNENIIPAKIDLTLISKVINSLNNIMAPVMSKDINAIKTEIDKKNTDSKSKLIEVKTLNGKLSELRVEKLKLAKRIKIVALLGEMYSTCAMNDKSKKEMILMMKDLDNYTDSKLDAQINKLERLMGKVN